MAQYVWYGGFAAEPIFGLDTGKLGFQSTCFDKLQTGSTAVPRAHNTEGYNLKHINKIRWSKEVINTRPQSIELSKEEDEDQSTIFLTQQGVYQLEFVLFIPE